MPGVRDPHAQSVAQEGLFAGFFETHNEVAEEGAMPPILMFLQQAVRFLERKQVQDELPDLVPRGGVGHLFVQYTCVGGCEDRVCPVRAFRYAVDDCVAQALEVESVGKDPEVEERVVGRLSIFERDGVDGACVQPADE